MRSGSLLRFLDEESGQVSVEYYLMVGAAILAAVMMISTYRKTAYANEMKYISEIHSTYDTMCTYIETYLEADFDVCGEIP